jgi:hypothetical protein
LARKEAKVVAEKRRFDPVPMPLSQLLPQLIATNLVTTVPPKPVTDPPPKGFDPNARCDYNMGSPGHWTDRCFRLRHKVQDLLDQELLNFETDQGSKPNGNSNDIGLSSNKISSKGRILDPSQLITPPGTRVRLKIKEGEDLPEVAMIASTGGKPAEEALVNKPSGRKHRADKSTDEGNDAPYEHFSSSTGHPRNSVHYSNATTVSTHRYHSDISEYSQYLSSGEET